MIVPPRCGAKVGHRQVLTPEPLPSRTAGVFFWALDGRPVDLSQQGVAIMSRQATRYAADAAARSRVLSEALGLQWGTVPIHVFETLPSTSRWLADRPLDQPTLAVADEQTRGRGRQGREWQSPSGGIYFSLGLPMDRGVSVPDGLSLVMGLQLAEALTAAGFAGIALKWPNDLVVNDAKLGGLLVERLPNALIVGVGVNTRPLSAGAAVAGRPVISLRELADCPTGDALIGTIAGAVLTVTTWTATQVEWLLETRWPVFDALADRVVIAEQADGTRREGRVLGVTAAGNLRLQTDTGEHRLAAGECHIGPQTGAAS